MPGTLLIHRDKSIQQELQHLAGQEFGDIDLATDLEEGLAFFGKKRYELTLLDTGAILNGADASTDHFKKALRPFRRLQANAWLVALAAKDAVREAVMAVKAGADDYLTYPILKMEFDLITQRISDTRRQEAELEYLRDHFWDEDVKDQIQTASPIMKKLYQNVQSVAPTRSTVLIQGETGVGKGVLARLIHRHSNRMDGPFIAIHCGAIPDNLIESELFGHEKGAFTGAIRRKLGRFEMADKGTLFLDEIGTVTPQVQIKLLKVLQEGLFHRVGGDREIEVDVRVIAATNENLMALCDEGRFRRDLFYRLNVFPIEMPPLRQRAEDIPHFVKIFLEQLNRNHSRNIRGVDAEVIAALKRYPWPGNIRELENLVERAYILERGVSLSLDSFPTEVIEGREDNSILNIDVSLPISEARTAVLERFESQYISELLTRNQGRIKPTAEQAGIGVRQLHKLMTRYQLDKNRFK